MKYWNYNQTIPMFWWHRGKLNMGDEASAYIVRHLTPNTVVRVGIPSTIKKSFFDVLRSIKSCKQPSLKSFFRTLFDNTPFLVSLGSIITYSNKHGIIWGSGFQTKEYKFNGGILLAVRGYETVKELKHRGITPPLYRRSRSINASYI